MIVNRANGRFVERMTRRLKETDCGGTRVILDEQVFMDSAVTYEDGVGVSSIAISTTNKYIITAANHGFTTGDIIVLRNVAGAVYLSNTKWSITVIDANTFLLVTQII